VAQKYFTGDPGGVDHLLKKDEAFWFPLVPATMSKAGIGLTATDASNIQHDGGRYLQGKTEERTISKMHVHITDAKKNLASFPKGVEEGNGIMSIKGARLVNFE